MLPYRKVEAMQNERAAQFIREQERATARRQAANDEPGGLSELLGALAEGLASIGYRGRFGDDHPARPAF